MTQTKRTRLQPEERRAQLLDCAQIIIQERGLSSFTMDAVAREADVSNPLIYKYFDTRLSLLQILLQREYDRFYGNYQERLKNAADFEEIVTIAVTVNFEEASKGNILNILRSQPDIRAVLKDVRSRQAPKLGRYLIRAARERFPLSREDAELVTVLASGASQSAAEYYGNNVQGREKLIKDTVRFILGAIGSFGPRD